MPKQPEGYGKRGKPTSKDINTLKDAKAILESNNMIDAYMKRHPKSSRFSARCNANRMITPEVMEKVRQLLQLDKLGETTKDLLEKVLHMVIARWLNGEERTGDMLTAIGYLSKLVPDFKDRQLIEDLSKKSPAEIDDELRKLGVTFGPQKDENADPAA